MSQEILVILIDMLSGTLHDDIQPKDADIIVKAAINILESHQVSE